MDYSFYGLPLLYAILVAVIPTVIALLLLYGVVRVAVARGLRDHQLWMEKNRPTAGPPTEYR
jgi:uncharacterized membrane protein